MRRILWSVIALATLAFAQDAPDRTVPKIIPVHYVNVDHLRDLVSIPGVSVKSDNQMRVLIVSGRPDSVAAIEEMVKKLDVPPPTEPAGPDFELTGYLVSGSSQARADEVPADLTATVKQLHALFPHKSYRVMETFVIRGTPARNDFGGPFTSGILPGTTSEYRFAYSVAGVSAGPPRSVHLRNLSLNIATPTTRVDKEGKVITRDVGIRTDIDVPEGQKVVVGKSNFTGGDDALILVLSAKIVE